MMQNEQFQSHTVNGARFQIKVCTFPSIINKFYWSIRTPNYAAMMDIDEKCTQLGWNPKVHCQHTTSNSNAALSAGQDVRCKHGKSVNQKQSKMLGKMAGMVRGDVFPIRCAGPTNCQKPLDRNYIDGTKTVLLNSGGGRYHHNYINHHKTAATHIYNVLRQPIKPTNNTHSILVIVFFCLFVFLLKWSS